LRARLSTSNDLLAETRALATEKDAVLQEQQQTIETISD
jgi:chromosome segregation ATPase